MSNNAFKWILSIMNSHSAQLLGMLNFDSIRNKLLCCLSPECPAEIMGFASFANGM